MEPNFYIKYFATLKPHFIPNGYVCMTKSECLLMLENNPGCNLDGDIDRVSGKAFNVLAGLIANK